MLPSDSDQRTKKISINQKHDMVKVKDIINANNPDMLVLESDKSLLNLKTNSIAYKLVMDYEWVGIEVRGIKRKKDPCRLLRITLIRNHIMDKYRLRHNDAEVFQKSGGEPFIEMAGIGSSAV
ncbi:hypothetical protein BEH94_04105 [Candidatus Altiarchaeales archaeon WOR_SM1_SCG]|nr:hypothetical protein BEH94_04105 [Candidatus Altiarchaeales archaeon WOR_SM1_SCG]